MHKIKLKKRQIFNHNGSMTIDVNFDDGKEAFNRAFVFPIDATDIEIKTEIKEWLEEKNECDDCVFDCKVSIDISKLKTNRLEKKKYKKAKNELKEMVQLIALGAMMEDDVEVVELRSKIKKMYKPEYASKK